MKANSQNHSNNLIHESSPYLLQHAHNPVNWIAWNDENLEKAEKENKLLIISVGYSACHWCHVMEHESFEDEEVSALMNNNYTCIKVDREERPDVDQVYMNAVQIMTGAGGWPMNIVALPDGRPVWGGTYFRKPQWMNALQQIATLYQENPEQLLDYAQKLQEGLKSIQLIEPIEKEFIVDLDFMKPILKKWKSIFDYKFGGYTGAPKFMMPSNLEFLLRYSHQHQDQKLMEYTLNSLDKISYGGVYDQLGGGFSRYAVDEKWHIPHFEKMLYDNAQLITLYSEAYRLTKKSWYKEVVYQSLKFIEEELTDKTGAFYSALDADSLNNKGLKEEGAYYVWTKAELNSILAEDFDLFATYYNINPYGKWEEDNYVLIRSASDKEISQQFSISKENLKTKKELWHEKLLKYRRTRSKPSLDDKSLTSWNAMMLTGYCSAYKAFSEPHFLETAKKNAEFIIHQQIKEDGSLYHSYKNGKSTLNGYLEDYAFCIQAFLALYEISFEYKYINIAEKLTKVVLSNFRDPNSHLYFFNSEEDRQLITKTMEIADNVVPASNSVMANNLFLLGKITANYEYIEKAEKMFKTIINRIPDHPSSYSNWLNLYLNVYSPFYEVAITGEKAYELAKDLHSNYLPNIVLAGSKKPEDSPLLKNRFKANQNLIYVCSNGQCELPVNTIPETLQLIE